jgi:hypothetical protein
MATTVIQAFNQFLRESVNLDPTETISAKSSRRWLFDRINEFPSKDSTFPQLHDDSEICFGSFERKTKKRPLDDIDIMVCMHANGATWEEAGGSVYLTVGAEASPLFRLTNDENSLLNSRKVINKFVSALSAISQYEKAELNRRGEAATLNLKSYPWVFDIVPCFITAPDFFGRTFYIIPDGSGNWKKTDPTIDRGRVQRIVQNSGSNVLNVIRLVKFWNRRPTMPSMGSYMLENMVLDYYESHTCGEYPDLEFIRILQYMTNAVYGNVSDPKGIQGNLNTLTFSECFQISNRCGVDLEKCNEARIHENAGEYQKSINKWAEVFGPSFPSFS